MSCDHELTGQDKMSLRGEPSSIADPAPVVPGYSARGLADIAKQWGYDCQISSIAGRPPLRRDTQPLARGRLWNFALPGGIRLCGSDLVATCDNERAGIVPRSLTIILTLEGTPVRYDLGAGTDVVIERGRAAMITASDATRLSSRYRSGERARCVVMQVDPQGLADDALGESVRRKADATGIVPLSISSRLTALVGEVLSSDQTSSVTHLLAESCALELLARALASDGQPALPSDRAGSREKDGIWRVRDLLAAEPGNDYCLSDLAKLAGVSISGLKAKFPALTGQSVFDFLRDQRLERGRRGLTSEGWSVKQAAFFAGYAHPSNFATAYRRKFGVAPRNARSG